MSTGMTTRIEPRTGTAVRLAKGDILTVIDPEGGQVAQKYRLRGTDGREVERLTLYANAATRARLGPVLGDVLSAARCAAHSLATRDALADGEFAVEGAVYAERPEAPGG